MPAKVVQRIIKDTRELDATPRCQISLCTYVRDHPGALEFCCQMVAQYQNRSFSELHTDQNGHRAKDRFECSRIGLPWVTLSPSALMIASLKCKVHRKSAAQWFGEEWIVTERAHVQAQLGVLCHNMVSTSEACC